MIKSIKAGFVKIDIDDSIGKICSFKILDDESLIEKPDSIAESSSRDQFDINQAWGWDECFPNIGVPENSNLRDHGNCWGNPSKSEIRKHENGQLEIITSWDSLLERKISLSSISDTKVGLEIELIVSNRLKEEADYQAIYSAHPLFKADTNDELKCVWNPENLNQFEELCLFERIFPEPEVKQAEKIFIKAPEKRGKINTRLLRKNYELEFEQDLSSLPFLGIWWCNNGWGDGRPHRTIGIEPCNYDNDLPPKQMINTENSLFKYKIFAKLR